MRKILLGLSDAQIGDGPYDSRPTGWWWGHKCSALADGVVTGFELYSNSEIDAAPQPVTVKAGLYSSKTGYPEGVPLLSGSDVGIPVVGGVWNYLPLPAPQPVSEDAEYVVAVDGPSAEGAVTSKDMGDDSSYYYVEESGIQVNAPSALYGFWETYTTNRKLLVRAVGYVRPSVSKVNRGLFVFDTQTNIEIDGSDFVDFENSVVDSKVYLCPTSTFADAIEQSVTRITDERIRVTASLGGLEDEAYLFVETGLGQLSEPVLVPLTDRRPDLLKNRNDTRSTVTVMKAQFKGSGEEHKAKPVDRGEYETAYVEAVLDWKHALAALAQFDRLGELTGRSKR